MTVPAGILAKPRARTEEEEEDGERGMKKGGMERRRGEGGGTDMQIACCSVCFSGKLSHAQAMHFSFFPPTLSQCTLSFFFPFFQIPSSPFSLFSHISLSPFSLSLPPSLSLFLSLSLSLSLSLPLSFLSLSLSLPYAG